MPFSITLPAVTRPRRRAEIFTRLRLLDLLYELLERKLILVVAPAGYGKTTLLIDFTHQKDLSACWYTVDRHDTDLARFLAHFIAAISRVYPEFGALSNAALRGLNRPDYDIEAFVRTFVNELFETVHEHFVFVLDDFHLVSTSQAISSFICRFVSRVGEQCHLIISSRLMHCVPEFELFQARSQAGLIGLRELAFTPEDLQSFSANRKQWITYEQAADLVNQNEGWITGILLSSSPFAQEKHQFIKAQATIPNKKSLEKYWELLVNEQPQDIQDFLLYSSLFDEFNADILEAVLHPQIYPDNVNWVAFLNFVKHSNLFLLEVGEDSAWLRYHSLLQDYLRARIKRERPEEIEVILRQLVLVHLKREEWKQAYHTSTRLEDLSLKIDIIEQAGPNLIKHGRFNTLTEWLDDLPSSIASTHPGMLSLRGSIALMGNNIPQALDLLNQAYTGYLSMGSNSQIAQTLVRRSAANHFLGDYTVSLQDAECALELIGEDQNLLSLKAQALKNKGTSLHSLGRSADGIKDLELSLAIYETLKDFHSMARVNQELGIAQRAIGNFDAARNSYLRSEQFWRKDGNFYQLADLLNNLGVFYHHLGEYERAAAAFDEGLRYARLTGFTRLEAFLLASLGDLYADLKANDEAMEIFENGLAVAQNIQNRFLCFYLNFSLSRLARLAGEYERAACLLGLAREYAHQDSNYEQGLLALETGRMKMAEEQLQEAICNFENACQRFRDGNLATEIVQAHLYLSAALLHSGDDRNSLKALSLAFDAGSSLKTHHPLLIAARYASPAFDHATNDPKLGRKALHLLERLHSLDASLPEIRRKLRKSAVEVPTIGPRIVIRAFGEVNVQVNGKTFKADDWKSRTQRELFFYLLQSPSGASRETLLSMFWPDTEQNSNLLSNLLYKIRGFLGADAVHYHEGRYCFNRALDYEYDVEGFLEQFEKAKRTEDHLTRIDAYQRMLEFYHGLYLPEADSIWVETERAQLHRIYLEAVNNLGECYLLQGKYYEGMNTCWHALKRDVHCEEIYRLAMRISARSGDRASVNRYYQLCRRALNNAFNNEPSQETQSLFLHLTR